VGVGFLIAAAALAGLFVVLGGVWPALSESRAAKTYTKDGGYFYRFRAGFEIKATGEKIDFDYIVACNIRVTRWRDGGLSDDTTLSPRVMVQATADGHAVMLKTLNACPGLTSENDDVPPDVLPIAVWFESMDDLSHGLAYVSEDAYDNPLGTLRFRGARVEQAAREDWEAWRARAAASYLQRGALPGPWGYDYAFGKNEFDTESGKYARTCNGYSRLKLPETFRAKIRRWWPSERPRFWALRNEDDSMLLDVLSDANVAEPSGGGAWLKRFGTPGSGGGVDWSGVPLRSGRWVQRHPHVPNRWPTENYPLLWPPATTALPMTVPQPNRSASRYVQKLEFRDGALNGFAACTSLKDATFARIAAADPGWKQKMHAFEVDTERLREARAKPYALAPTLLFERDEYVFIRFTTGL
jgi:hypothetical protein